MYGAWDCLFQKRWTWLPVAIQDQLGKPNMLFTLCAPCLTCFVSENFYLAFFLSFSLFSFHEQCFSLSCSASFEIFICQQISILVCTAWGSALLSTARCSLTGNDQLAHAAPLLCMEQFVTQKKEYNMGHYPIAN